jgi:hypothetical protein
MARAHKTDAASPGTGASRILKRMHRKARPGVSLKIFARGLLEDQACMGEVDTWFKNKSTNFSKAPLGIGATRKKAGKGGSSSPKKP